MVGVTRGSIVIERVAVVAHCPAVGVNVYTVVPAVAVLMLAGLHEPVIPLEDDAGSVGAHCPAVGVNVYTVVPALVVLMLAGLHEPVIPLEDVVGSAGAVLL